MAVVRLLAHTQFDWETVSDLMSWGPAFIDAPHQADMLAEFAGRTCYESWNRPSAKTERNEDYLRNILDTDHFSVLEHASATFYLEYVSRTFTHELVRHRHLSYSQKSQRYVDESDCDLIIPEVMKDESDPELFQLVRAFRGQHERGKALYRQAVDVLRRKGINKKEARGAARAILSGNTRTSIVVSGNHRAWRDFLKLRYHMAADPEIRQIAGQLLDLLRSIAPGIYQDFPHVPFDGKPVYEEKVSKYQDQPDQETTFSGTSSNPLRVQDLFGSSERYLDS